MGVSMSDDKTANRMEALIGAYIEGSIDENGAEELLAFLHVHPDWNKEVTNQIFTETDLRGIDLFDDVVDGTLMVTDRIPCACASKPSRKIANRFHFSKRFAATISAIVALVVLPIMGMAVYSIFFASKTSKTDENFASMSRTTNCLWGDSTTQTSPGSRLGTCLLRLEQGIALIRFDCGMAVSLEGPSVFELKSEKYGILHAGRLVATAETPEGRGFIIDTPDSSIKDLGTKFAVCVPTDEPSEIHVLEGVVEVLSREFEKTHLLAKGTTMTVGVRNGNKDHTGSHLSNRQVTTAMGRGKESWAICQKRTLQTAARHFPQGVTKPFMQVKTEVQHGDSADRKAIFCLDLAVLDEATRKDFSRAELFLSYGPTEIGYASNVADSTFSVYGLVDETFDDWSEATIDWDTFPGNAQRNTLSSSAWILLGRFEIKQGSRSGVVQINGERLADFLRRDTNRLATFAIVCDTFATETFSLVFGFANRFHNELQPPRLVLQTEQ